MSLKARLRIVIVLLVVAVVSALSALHMYNLARDKSEDALDRTRMSAQQVYAFVQRLQPVAEDIAKRRPRTPEESLALWTESWTETVRKNSELTQLLMNVADYSKVIVEVLVASKEGEILADSLPSRVGYATYELPDFAEWVRTTKPWAKLFQIFQHRQDYQVTIPLGFAGQSEPVVTIKVIVSSVLLRETMLEQIRNITLIFLVALLLSTLLAAVVSNLALRPLASISQALDRISKGEYAKAALLAEAGSSKEFTAVQSKLNMLGQQFRGAREDAVQLRSNIEQLLERLEEVVFLFDQQDRLVMAGRAAERLLGRGRWEMMGRSVTDLFPASSALGQLVRSSLELRQPLRDHLITLDRDGAPPTRVLVNLEVLEAFPKHERIGTLLTLRDAETRRQIQSQLDVSTRLAAISRLTGGVAHEIKNPLQAIRVHLEVMRSKLAQEGLTVTEIDTIDREIMRLDRVVKTFLDFTRPVDLQMRELEMVRLVREVGALVGPAAKKKQIQTDFRCEEKEILVRGDRDLLQQAILNVVVNGIEAMGEGGRLKILLRRTGAECLVAISDDGPGIPPEIREKIFNLYFSTKGKGSGIGLAMTFRVVQLHNGTIDFTSEPGEGTTFRLRFPAIEREPYPAVDLIAGKEKSGL